MGRPASREGVPVRGARGAGDAVLSAEEPPRGSPRPRAPVAEADVGISLDELDVLLRLGDILRRVRFGSVLIVVREGKAVQLELAEKVRL